MSDSPKTPKAANQAERAEPREVDSPRSERRIVLPTDEEIRRLGPGEDEGDIEEEIELRSAPPVEPTWTTVEEYVFPRREPRSDVFVLQRWVTITGKQGSLMAQDESTYLAIETAPAKLDGWFRILLRGVKPRWGGLVSLGAGSVDMNSRSGLLALTCAAMLALVPACAPEETIDPCDESPDSPDAPPVDIEGGGWADTFCAIQETRGLRCWGSNLYGEIAPPAPEIPEYVDVPLQVRGVGCVSSVSPGGGLTCALLAKGGVRCWGTDEFGQMGNGGSLVPTGVPDDVNGIRDAIQVRTFGVGASALRNASVWAWGRIDQVDSNHPAPIPEAGQDVTSYGLFPRGGCAAHENGSLSCWGQSLTDAKTPYAQPTTIVPSGVREIAAGYEHACLMTDTGTVACWGSNYSGELGDGTFEDRESPAPVLGLDAVVQVVVGGSHSCARREDGSIWCWGLGGLGALGPVGWMKQPQPVLVPLARPAVDVAAVFGTTCALDDEQVIWCWGGNMQSELGTTENIQNSPEPRRVDW